MAVQSVESAGGGTRTLGRFLADVEGALRAEVAGAGLLEEAARPLVLATASKRARPMVAWLVGEVVGARPAVVESVAVAVELVHSASLLHDDIIDGAVERRGVPTANARWGPTIAVLAGDLLMTAALRRLRSLGPEASARGVDVIAEMTRAVAFEVARRRDPRVTPGEWRAMAEGKTGALFGLAGGLVAHDGEGPRYDRALRHLGVAFQIADDLGDLDAAGGETPYQDLRDGNPSLPVLLAVQGSPALRERLGCLWGGAAAPAPAAEVVELAQVAREILAAPSVALARAQVRVEVARARELLAPELARGDAAMGALMRWAEALASAGEPRYGAAAPGPGGAP